VDNRDFQSYPPDSKPPEQGQPANRAGTVIAFPLRSQSSEWRLLRFLTGKQANQKPQPKAKELLSKHTKSCWALTVGARVAAIADGRIVQGVILGRQGKPWRAAAFHRGGFSGCWILLDSGERIVAHGLRPIGGIHPQDSCPVSVSGSYPVRQSRRRNAKGPVQKDFSWEGNEDA
jgi:hypothetical protein